MDIEVLLTRVGALSKFFNQAVIEVLEILGDDDPMRPRNLRKLIVDTIPVYDMFRQHQTRNILINTMTKSEAEDFAKCIGITEYENVHYRLQHIKFTQQVLQRVAEFFDKEFDVESIIARPDTETVEPERYLFEHQVNTIKKIQDMLSKRPHKALLHMPTGSGKTVSAMRVVLMHLLQNPQSLIIWLAHNEELCEQAVAEFKKTWRMAGSGKINTYRFFGQSKLDLRSVECGFVSAGLAKMLGAAKKDNTFLSRIAKRVGVVVIDEAHQATAEKYSIIIKELSIGDKARLLGLSATPGRKSDLTNNANRQLAQFFARKKVMLDTGKENPITFLIRSGYLAKPQFHKVMHGGKSLSKHHIAQIIQNIDIPKQVLEVLSDDAKRNISIIHEAIRLAKTHKKIILFASSIEHARTISVILTAKNHNSYYITNETPRTMRSTILKDYKDTEKPMILCNYGILTTGFDAPKTSAIVIARPTKSSVLYAQMVGRGLRGPKAGGNKRCEISTVIDKDIQEFINITEIFMQWESAWNE